MRNPGMPKGVTIAEMLIGLVIVGVIGMGVTRLVLAQTRFFEHQTAARNARNVSRSGLNQIVSDLRMLESSGGVVAASSNSITVRVPYALGVSCTQSTISVMPSDSATYAKGISGYAWRAANGTMTYQETGVSAPAIADASICTNAGITVLTSAGGKAVSIVPALPAAATLGTPLFLFRQIRYAFKNSLVVPGKIGLFRADLSLGGTEEEISAPFDASAKFRFYVNFTAAAQDSPPASLASLRGFELNLSGNSERAALGTGAVRKEPNVTGVFFKNRLN